MPPFLIDAKPVTNAQFREFVRATKYKTDAEKFGWSFVLEPLVDERVKKTITEAPENAPWWLPVKGATWRAPHGAHSPSLNDRLSYPGEQQ